MRILLLLILFACGGADSDSETSEGTDCLEAGVYGDPDWSLEVRGDCSAFLMGFCGEGEIEALAVDGDALQTDLTWHWVQGGPVGETGDPATLEGTVTSGVVDGTLSWLERSEEVHAELGVSPGDGLGLDACPLD